MEHKELYILGLIGVVLHLLKNILVARKQVKELDTVAESISFVISTLIVGVLVYAKNDLESLYPLTLLTTTILGYSAQSLFKFLVDHFAPK